MKNASKIILSVIALTLLSGCQNRALLPGGETSSATNIKCTDREFAPNKTICATKQGIKFTFIPNGTFEMGTATSNNDKWGYNDETPRHKVTITQNFFLGVTEVTQGEWKAITDGNNPSINQVGDDYPVENISWKDIKVFLNTLNANEPNITISGVKYRYDLPTEAQWEYAARAGVDTDQAWFFGDKDKEAELSKYAHFSALSTIKVKSKEPNPWGLYDIYGNVWEWVKDQGSSASCDYSLIAHFESIDTDPICNDTSASANRLYRGGGFDFDAAYSRSTIRRSIPLLFGGIATRVSDIGIRLALVSVE